jgi:indoleamine 2,3-dioxygenase
MDPLFKQRGFLPASDPLKAFEPDSPLARLDELGRDLPSMLHDAHFRDHVRRLEIPSWAPPRDESKTLETLRLYYVRLGFLASAYVNQVGQPPANVLPRNIAVPLCHVCKLLGRPPILSYDGYALYNWKRFDPAGPIALGNLDTIQNFVHLYDEHWFILVHIEIEAIAADLLAAIDGARRATEANDAAGVNQALTAMGRAVWRQVEVLRRIPEHMDPALYF